MSPGRSSSVVGNETTWPEQQRGVLYAIAGEMLRQGFMPDEISKVELLPRPREIDDARLSLRQNEIPISLPCAKM